MLWQRRSPQPEHSESIVEAAECLLQGQYLEGAYGEDREIPSWAWLSTLAHGDKVAIEIAEHWSLCYGSRPELAVWERVLQHLARQIRLLVDASGASLDEIQRSVLIPIELENMISPIGPISLYREVSAALNRLCDRAAPERA